MRQDFSFHLLLLEVFLVLICLSSCCPRTKVPTKILDTPAGTLETRVDSYLQGKAFVPVDQWSEDWWLTFDDEQLDCLIRQGLAFHPSIEKAAILVRQAGAQARITRASLLPTLDFDADVMRYQVSKTGLFGVLAEGAKQSSTTTTGTTSTGLAAFPFYYTQSEFYFNFNYEIDWWGKNRDALYATLGEVQARIAEQAIARLTLSTNIAEAYIHLQAAMLRESLAARYADNRSEVIDLVKKRVGRGLDSSLRIHDYEQLFFQSHEQLEAMRQIRVFYEDTLRSLISATFQETFEQSALFNHIKPLALPINLPLDLLARRPDITAQIWRIYASFKQVDVACKEFYPNLNLMGIWGHQTLFIKELFENRSSYAQYGPAISLPVFRGGALVANLDERNEEYLGAIVDYETMILDIVRDVFTGLSAVDAWDKRVKYLTENVRSAEEEYELNAKRLNSNIANRIDLLESERVKLSALDALAVDQENYLIAQLTLIKTLGGGYLAPGAAKPDSCDELIPASS